MIKLDQKLIETSLTALGEASCQKILNFISHEFFFFFNVAIFQTGACMISSKIISYRSRKSVWRNLIFFVAILVLILTSIFVDGRVGFQVFVLEHL